MSLADLKREVRAAEALSNTASAVLETSLQRMPSTSASDWSLPATPTCRSGVLHAMDRRVSLLERKQMGLGRGVAAVRGALSGQSIEERLIISLITGVTA